MAIVAVAAALLGGSAAFAWDTWGARPAARPPWDGAVMAPDRWDAMELLNVDSDGSLLVAFYDGSGVATAFGGAKANVGQLPGVALVTPDGAVHVLRETADLNARAFATAVGSVHHGEVAVAWQVVDNAVDAQGELNPSSRGRTVTLATGTSAGLTDIPSPTVGGLPVVVQWGGLQVADDALVAMVMDASGGWAGRPHIGVIDTATGELAVIHTGSMLAPMRDLCDAEGNSLGATTLADNTSSLLTFSVSDGRASAPVWITPPFPGLVFPASACGADSAGADRKTQALWWTNGPEQKSAPRLSGLGGDVLLAPDWVAVQQIDVDLASQDVVVVDRTTRQATLTNANCDRIVASGDWLAFGYPSGDGCLPVAVRPAELAHP